MAKLTLSVDGSVIARAKRYAMRHGTSVSGLVEHFLQIVSGAAEPPDEALPPILARLRRELRGTSVDRAAYRRHLERKYR